MSIPQYYIFYSHDVVLPPNYESINAETMCLVTGTVGQADRFGLELQL